MFFPLSNRWLIQFPPNFIFSCKGNCLLYSEYLESTEFFLFSAEILSSLIPSQCSSDQSLSRVRLFVTSWTAARQASLSITNSRSLLKLMSIEFGDAIQSSYPLVSPSPALNLSQHQSLFKWVSSSYQMAKYWNLSFNISPSNEHSGLISFRMDWLDLLAVQGTLKSLLQYHSSKASILWRSAFFIVQLSHPCMTTGKTIALTRWTFVGKLVSLLFNMLSKLVITFLPRSKCLFISWLQSTSAVILEPPPPLPAPPK